MSCDKNGSRSSLSYKLSATNPFPHQRLCKKKPGLSAAGFEMKIFNSYSSILTLTVPGSNVGSNVDFFLLANLFINAGTDILNSSTLE